MITHTWFFIQQNEQNAVPKIPRELAAGDPPRYIFRYSSRYYGTYSKFVLMFFFFFFFISLLLLFLVGTKNSIVINVKYYVKEHCLEFRVSSVNLPRNSTLRRYLSRSDPFVGFMASQSPFFPRQTSWCISLKIKKKKLEINLLSGIDGGRSFNLDFHT